jgi:hypothetical protein
MAQIWIAEDRVIFLHPNGVRVPGRIAVGAPVLITEGVEADCMIALDGFEVYGLPFKGTSTLQALLMAVQFIGWRLHNFISNGGRVLDPNDGSDFGLEAYFGPLLRPTPDTKPPVIDGADTE